jgi:hypothetical protein
MKPVQKTDLNVIFPMPAQQITIVLDRVFSSEEAALLKLGFAPREMQDKWFIYFENDVLHFHRSWTGYCVYQVFFAPEADGALRMTRATISRDPEQHKETRAERDAWMISNVIDSFLLRRDD